MQYVWQSSVFALLCALVCVGREKHPTSDGAGAGALAARKRYGCMGLWAGFPASETIDLSFGSQIIRWLNVDGPGLETSRVESTNAACEWWAASRRDSSMSSCHVNWTGLVLAVIRHLVVITRSCLSSCRCRSQSF